MNVDVLNLEWTSTPSRDREVATMVCNYLRFQGLSVSEGSIFNGYHLINKLKPKILFMTNTVGSHLSQNVMRYAKKKKVVVITGFSEGYLRRETLDEMVWGHNKNKLLFEDSLLVWSTRSLNMILNEYPDLKLSLKVSGSVGLDRYKILNALNKKENQDSLTVGIGCWGFDNFIDKKKSLRYKRSTIKFFQSERDSFNKILASLIKNNPDINFLIKEHPGNELGYEGSGIESCVNYKNVKVFQNEKSITSCILESDLWLTYDSTTALEAWLLDKQTCILNPSVKTWPIDRDKMHLSQPVYRDLDEIQKAVNNLKSNKKIPGFEKSIPIRKIIINEISDWVDGLNHVRVGNEIIAYLKIKSKNVINEFELSPPNIFTRMKQKLRWHLIKLFPTMKKFYNKNERHRIWNEYEVKELSKKRLKQQIEFYKKRNLEKKSLRKIKSI